MLLLNITGGPFRVTLSCDPFRVTLSCDPFGQFRVTLFRVALLVSGQWCALVSVKKWSISCDPFV